MTHTTPEIEELLWQVKGDMHNIVGEYNPAFTDKLERHLIKLVTTLTTKHQEELEKAVEVLELVLPMAKGYAHEHNLGRNKEIVQHAEEILQSLTPTKTDKQTEV